MRPDPRPAARVRDPGLLRQLHLEWRSCALATMLPEHERQLSLHHVSKHPRDDVRGNLVMLCGSGTTGCHGLVEAADEQTCYLLGQHLFHERWDTVRYLLDRYGTMGAQAFLARHYLVGLA